VNYKPMPPEQVRFIVVHCSASQPKAKVDASVIDRWHRERGFLMIGYHIVVLRDGTVQTGRETDQPGAHAEGFNNKSIGICLVGGVNEKLQPENNFTPEQFDRLKQLIVSLRVKFTKAEVLGHRDLPGVTKACPSFDVRAWLRAEGL
jgi:N-acetylmuramoyl-L-alanine amidase